MSTVVAEVRRLARGRQVEQVEIEVGPTIELDHARSAWEHLVEETELQGVPVEWRRVFHVLTCLSCFTDYGGDKLEPCPACGGDGLVSQPAPEILATVGEVVG